MAASVQSGASDTTASVDSKAFGLEAIAAYKSIKFQGEYTKGDYKANYMDVASVSLDNEAYYGEVMWLVSGENYSSAYKKGSFSSIKPNKNFDLENFSGLGAWELGLRYEAYEVSDGKSVGYTGTVPTSTAAATRWQGNVSCNGTTANALTSSQSNCSSGANTWTAGIKWIINPNVMVKGAYSRTSYDNAWSHFDIANGGIMKYEDLLSVRTQFAF
jgi:phosphate-selective porin OprO/OprP